MSLLLQKSVILCCFYVRLFKRSLSLKPVLVKELQQILVLLLHSGFEQGAAQLEGKRKGCAYPKTQNRAPYLPNDCSHIFGGVPSRVNLSFLSKELWPRESVPGILGETWHVRSTEKHIGAVCACGGLSAAGWLAAFAEDEKKRKNSNSTLKDAFLSLPLTVSGSQV